jgi:hypothetical protein
MQIDWHEFARRQPIGRTASRIQTLGGTSPNG